MSRACRILHRPGWVGLLAALLFAAAGIAGELPAAEERLIEALIARVAGMTDAAFIRNDRSYDAATAAEFLRRKWRRHAAEVRSAEDFIDRIASASSTTGRALPDPVRRRPRAALRDGAAGGAAATAKVGWVADLEASVLAGSE